MNSHQRPNEDYSTEVSKALSEEESTLGFDLEAGKSWFYPTNYPLRDYQFSIIQECLYKNTLVSLPTGLGKTFIAAVVMYNFYRWYPSGKIIFMAPSRPLVKQQVDACCNIMAIPKEVTVELTGSIQQAARKSIWEEKRVFFITPQILQNDLNIIENLGSKLKFLVFDEAHRAKKKYAYCEVIRRLYPKNKYFRVLALSATPGSNLKDIYEVINNLLIAHLEVRTEESPDVAPYVFQRTVETVVVPLGGKLEQIKEEYIKLLEKHSRTLVKHRVITGNYSQLTKGKIFLIMKDFQEKNGGNRDATYNEITRSLNICLTLYHAYDLLIRHGLRGFLSFFEDHVSKPLFRGMLEIQAIMEDIREYLGPVPSLDPLPDGSIPEIPDTITFGHPKYYELEKILKNHFSNPENTDSRVIIFCEYKESVMEAYTLLLQSRPLIKPEYFMGQGAMQQRLQLKVLKSFREGICNTLISTCIGEEGLDVGEVDLIVCFDINNKSPIRMVQRMGRTGRKRKGKVIILVTEGKEQQILKECLEGKQILQTRMKTSAELRNGFFKNNPRMIPDDINPRCQKIHMTITNSKSPSTSTGKKPKSFKMMDFFEDKPNRLAKKRNSDETKEVKNKKSTRKKSVEELKDETSQDSNFEKPLKKGKPTKRGPTNAKLQSTDNFKQCDLRNMFSNNNKTESSSGKSIILQENEEIIEIFDNSPILLDNDKMLEELNAEIATFLSTKNTPKSCKLCSNNFNCTKLSKSKNIQVNFDFEKWSVPDDSVINLIDSEALIIFAESLEPKYQIYNEFDMPDCVNFAPNSTFNDLSVICDNKNNYDGQDFKTPKRSTHCKPLSANKSIFENVKLTQLENDAKLDLESFIDDSFREKLFNSTNFKNGKNITERKYFDENFSKIELEKCKNETIDEIFMKESNEKLSKKYLKDSFDDACNFFYLQNILDIYFEKDTKNENFSQNTVIYDLTDSPDRPVSPILSGNEKLNSFKLKAKEKLILTQNSKSSTTQNNNYVFEKQNSNSSQFMSFINDKTTLMDKKISSESSLDFENDKSAYLSQKILATDKIDKLNDKNHFNSVSLHDLDDFCDLSTLGITVLQNIENTPKSTENIEKSHKNHKKSDKNTDFFELNEKENVLLEKYSPIISQFEKSSFTKTLPSQVTLTQAVNLINNKKKQINVTTLLKDLDENDFSDDFCFVETSNKQVVTPKNDANVKSATSGSSGASKILPSSSANAKNKTKNKRGANIFISKALKFDSDSDNDFEETSTKLGSIWLSKNSSRSDVVRNNHGNQLKGSYKEHEFAVPFSNNVMKNCKSKPDKNGSKGTSDKDSIQKKEKRKKKSANSSFIEEEAEVDDSDHEVSTDTSEGSEDDVYEKSFVNDETQDLINNTVIHAEYLKSIRSPTFNRGKFKIPEKLPTRMDVYSQVPNTEENSYLNDSFCDDEIKFLTQKDELSLLEIAEMQLKEERKERKSKKRKSSENEKSKTKKRRIIICISSDESD